MKNLKLILYTGFTALLFSSCSHNETENTPAEESGEKVAEKVAEQAPVTHTSASSFEVDQMRTDFSGNETGGSFRYTILDYTMHVPNEEVKVSSEHALPYDWEQMVSVRIEVETLSLTGVTFLAPSNSFTLLVGDEKFNALNQFEEEFKETVYPSNSEVGEKQTISMFYAVPVEADLSKAKLSLFQPGDRDPLVFNLN